MITVRDTGLVYRNPRPELRSKHTWHPTIIRFDDGEMLVTFDIADADVALDYRTYATHSTDAGASWSDPERVVPDPPGRPTTQSVRIQPDVGRLGRRDGRADVPRRPGEERRQRAQPRLHGDGADPHPEPGPRPHLEPDRADHAAARGPGLRGLPLDHGAERRPVGLAVLHLDGLGRRRPQRHERDPAGVRGPGQDVADVHHRVRPLGRAHHPLGAALPRAGRWPLADRRLGRWTSTRARRCRRRTPSATTRARPGSAT